MDRTVAFTFGRFNPPTKGHMKVVDVLEIQNADNYMIFLSHSYKPPKNPLPYDKKFEWFKKSLKPEQRKYLIKGDQRTIIDIAMYLKEKGFNKVILVLGEDRAKELGDMLKNYNGKEARHGYYKFDDIKVVMAGKRNEKGEGIEGISSTKVKEAVTNNSFEKFKEIVSDQLTEKEKLEMFQDLKQELKVNESLTIDSINNFFRGLLRG